MTAPYSASYRFHSVGLNLLADERWLIEKGETTLGPMAPCLPLLSGCTATITAHSQPADPCLSPKLLDRARKRFEHFGTQCYGVGQDLWLLDEAVRVLLPSESPEATVWVAARARDATAGYHRALVVTVIELFRLLGLYQLHAGCVTDGCNGILFCGGQRHGKSTATIAMALGGWECVTDDLLFLQQTEDGIGCQGWREDFNVGAATIEAFHLGRHVGRLRSDGRYSMDPSFLSLADDSLPIYPNHLLFTHITEAPTSSLTPVPRSQALLRMVQYSPMVLVAGRRAHQHLEVLRHLVLQCECLDLHAGRDVLDGRLPSIIASHLSS